ncbi:DegV family protein with EDD domain [Deinobacterium chartae]|uniref:DegV family protein with EDD domain n=1 Tax=Deinobacterium chartae TaxID=521158 RepID=A0A841I6P0_9DEIO|nr:DegV family protein [Deinobacterium chartae]MBB6099562.1 DegV family protein with EDD domain [Deinobacterium chartae]
MNPEKELLFNVVSDGGVDFVEGLEQVDTAPLSLHFGNRSYLASDLSFAEFMAELRRNPLHPTTSQPTPSEFAQLFTAHADRPVLCATLSSGLSGSRSAAEQARGQLGNTAVEIVDTGTLSAAQAFQVHAAATARRLGHTLEVARGWMQQVAEETELFFTIETLEYLRKGGRIGRVQAALGGLLNLKPVITVDKSSGTYVNVARARSYLKAIESIASLVTARFGAGTPLRVGLLHGSHRADAEKLLDLLRAQHPISFAGFAVVGSALAVHTGPRAVGVAVAPGDWPWERAAQR